MMEVAKQWADMHSWRLHLTVNQGHQKHRRFDSSSTHQIRERIRGIVTMFPNEQAQDNFFNSIGLISLLVGVQNLQENRQQTAANDVHTANDEQAKLLWSEIRRSVS